MRKQDSHKTITVVPNGLGGLGLWAGSDHYGFFSALRRAPFSFPAAGLQKISRIAFSDIPGFQEDRFLLEYNSGSKDCMVVLDQLPEELKTHKLEKVSPFGTCLRYLDLFRREPSSMLLPLALPLGISLVMTLFGLWSDLFLRNIDVLNFFARPGCDAGCVERVLRLHSLVGMLFLIQFFLLLMPFSFLFFHAPRYRYAFNVRITQMYSITTAIIGVFVFAQLMVFFPFKQYSRFLALGLDPKVERLLSHLNEAKEKTLP
ncbi:MAG: hypothetical protein ACXWQO_14300 [Bdellovibrionota bacterium]